MFFLYPVRLTKAEATLLCVIRHFVQKLVSAKKLFGDKKKTFVLTVIEAASISVLKKTRLFIYHYIDFRWV